MTEFEKRILADGRAVIYRGDSLALLESGAIEEFWLTVTDPPYMLGAISAGDKNTKSGKLVDLLNFATWYAYWIKMCAEGGRPVMVFGNWRSIPVYQTAFERAGCRTYSCIVWDKEWPGRGQYVRPTYEVVILGASVKPVIPDRCARDIIRCKWNAVHSGVTGHPAEKPVELLQKLVNLVDYPRDLPVFDPFMGSGTTGVACLLTGRRFIGVEIDPAHFEVACKRIEAAWAKAQAGELLNVSA